jgi:dienelactone hydrolase
MPSRKLHLSPSENHRYVLDHTAQSLAFGGGDVRAWQRKLWAKVAQLIGLDVMPAKRPPLGVQSIWKQQFPDGTVEKIAFAAEPQSDILAYVALPKTARPPYTFFICLQGHSTGMHVSISRDRDDEFKRIKPDDGDRDFAIGCMRRGIAALCIEQRSFGLRRELLQKRTWKHGCIDATMHALQLGRTLIGERVYDVDRGIDYLASRGDVDMSRVGVMGNSGGGTISLFAAAMLPRLRLAMPSCYFCTFRDSIMAIEHCVDNYTPGLLRYAEMADVMGLFAPRPLVLVAGRTDPIFPLPGVRKAFRALKKIYAAAGAAGRCHLVVGPEGHRFYAELAWPKMLKEIEHLRPNR